MIRPVAFGYNEQTSATNSFQNKHVPLVRSMRDREEQTIHLKAREEFDTLVQKLKDKKINVLVFEDTLYPPTPDSIFPNNWISFHEQNTIVLYPMLAENRRVERREDIIHYFTNEKTNLIDLSENELRTIFLEGTGSIIFDSENKTAYANSSSRTNKELFEKLCVQLNYKPISFTAVNTNGQDIYHTNVLMCIGNTFAVLCKECIPNKTEIKNIVESLEKTNHEIIEISSQQMNAFAGNMYQLFNDKEESLIVMSEQAFKSLNPTQITTLEKHGTLIHSPLYTIEQYGGGSARCMIADVIY